MFIIIYFIVIRNISQNMFSSLAIFSDFSPSLICALPAGGTSSPVFIDKTRPMLIKSIQNKNQFPLTFVDVVPFDFTVVDVY